MLNNKSCENIQRVIRNYQVEFSSTPIDVRFCLNTVSALEELNIYNCRGPIT